MSMALAHFTLGAAATTVLVTVFVPVVWYPRTVVLIGGVWAILPDVHWVSPVAGRQLYALHSSPWANVFWFHRTLDRVDPTDAKAFAATCVALFVATTAFAEWRDYRAPAAVQSTYEDRGEDGSFR